MPGAPQTAGESDQIDLAADNGVWDGEDVAAIDADLDGADAQKGGNGDANSPSNKKKC